jgi:hypothetical protein
LQLDLEQIRCEALPARLHDFRLAINGYNSTQIRLLREAITTSDDLHWFLHSRTA